MPDRQITPADPAEREALPAPRLADAVPFFAEIEPAKNPVRMCLQDDGRKVLGELARLLRLQDVSVRQMARGTGAGRG